MKYILCLLRWNQLDCLGSGFAPVSGLPLVEDYLYIYIIYIIFCTANVGAPVDDGGDE